MLLGETFRLAREEKGQTISQVAEATRMMVQIVEDLEREDFRRIAAPIYGRGFIKLYAEHLGLDPEPLIRDFMEIYTGLRPPQVVRRSADLPPEDGAVASARVMAVETPAPALPPPEKPVEQPAGEPDLFSLAAGRSEAVRSVPDPAAPGETAPPRVRPASAHAELHPGPVEDAPRRAPVKLRPQGTEAAGDGFGGTKHWPQHWTPAIIGAIAAGLLLVLVAGLVVLSRKAGKTPRAQPASIKVERLLRPSAPYFD